MSNATVTPQLAKALAQAIRTAGLPTFSGRTPVEEQDGYVGFVIWTWAQEIEQEQPRRDARAGGSANG